MDLELKTFHTVSSMEQIADLDCYLELLELYEKGDLRYGKIIEYLAYRLSEDSVVYERYKSALAINGIVLAPKAPPFDYEKARREGRQYHFDMLFDKSRYISLVEKMLSIIGKGDISFAELKQTNTLDFYHDIDRHNPEENTILQLYFDLEDEHDKRPILKTLKGISDWNYYAICGNCNSGKYSRGWISNSLCWGIIERSCVHASDCSTKRCKSYRCLFDFVLGIRSIRSRWMGDSSRSINNKRIIWMCSHVCGNCSCASANP
jgi:hypothetical protein